MMYRNSDLRKITLNCVLRAEDGCSRLRLEMERPRAGGYESA